MKQPAFAAALNARLTVDARSKTEKVQQDLEVAEAELHMANTVLVQSLPASPERDEVVELALQQNVAVEDKVHDAAEELLAVTELLKKDEAIIAVLQKALAAKTGTGKSGEGAQSAMEQLSNQDQRRDPSE